MIFTDKDMVAMLDQTEQLTSDPEKHRLRVVKTEHVSETEGRWGLYYRDDQGTQHLIGGWSFTGVFVDKPDAEMLAQVTIAYLHGQITANVGKPDCR